MKKQIVVSAAVAIAMFLFASCQKDNQKTTEQIDTPTESTVAPPKDDHVSNDLQKEEKPEIKPEKKDVLIEPLRKSDGTLQTRGDYAPVNVTYPCLLPDFNTSTLYCGSRVSSSTVGRFNRYSNSFYNSLGLSSNLNGGDKVFYFNLTQESIVNLYLYNSHKNLAMILFKGHYEWVNGNIVERFDKLEAWSSSTSTTNESLQHQHLTSGRYMLIVDSAPHGESSFDIYLACTPVSTSCNTTPGYGLFYDNFEHRNLGGISPQSDNWNKWNNNIFDGEVVSGKYLKVDYKEGYDWGNQADFILDLGQRTSGNYQLEFNMWVYANNTANFNIQKIVRSEYGASFFIGKNGQSTIYLEGAPYKNFTFPNNQWAKVRFDVNLNSNTTSLSINGIHIASWLCTASLHPASANNKMFRGLNFLTSTYGLYYIDNVCFIKKF